MKSLDVITVNKLTFIAYTAQIIILHFPPCQEKYNPGDMASYMARGYVKHKVINLVNKNMNGGTGNCHQSICLPD